jgi:hypothetical protein
MSSTDFPPPVVLAMLICDHIHRDSSGKHFILGVFNKLNCSTFPITHPVMAIYLSLTEVQHRGTLRLRVIHVNEDRDPVYVTNAKFEAHDPVAVVEATFSIHNVTFSEPGSYRVQAFFNDEMIGERRLNVAPLPKSNG